MQIKILDQKKEPLLSRTIITAEVSFEASVTPSKEEVKKNIAAQLKAGTQTKSDSSPEKLTIVKKIHHNFGSTTGKITAYVYDSEKDMKNIEPKKKESKDKKPAEGAPAKPEEKKEEPKEDKPAEAPKEEKKSE